MALVLLDLSAAFDLVDHSILLSCLESCVGLRGMVLQWFRSYLSNRCFTVQIGHCISTAIPLGCGIPQGSILGPVLFSMYLLPLASIFEKYGVSFHLYADDTQLYLPLQRNNKYSLQPLLDCLNELKLWLSSNFLHLNENKSEIILFGPRENVASDFDLGFLTPYNTQCARNLGILFDSSLKFDKQISAVVKSCITNFAFSVKLSPSYLEKILKQLSMPLYHLGLIIVTLCILVFLSLRFLVFS